MDTFLTQDRQNLLNNRLKALGYEPLSWPTEQLPVQAGLARHFDRSIIGRPIANTAIYILDPHLQPTPIGVPGELYVGGMGLSLGYLYSPEMTAQKFIANPFGEGRLYKTGDWACYRADGTIAFLGRRDNQVKIRGFRVELGEIETTLGNHPDVRECAVMAREVSSGDRRLVAYIVSDAELDSEALRTYLKRNLLDYMVPSAFVALESLPLTPNGKLDRNALTSFENDRLSDTSFVAPNTPLQIALAQIFAEILSLPVEQIGIHNSFFELGGHSLLATQVVARICNRFPVELSLRAFFESPTVAAISTRIETAQPPQALAAIEPCDRTEALPLSFAQERLWLLDRLSPGNSAYNEVARLELLGDLDLAALQASLNAIVARHEVLRTTFPQAGGHPVQRIAEKLEIALPLIDLCNLNPTAQERELERLATAHTREPFDLTAGPLLRVKILRLSGDRHLALFAAHHIVIDGWSYGILIHEISQLYAAFKAGEAANILPELPIQYADFAAWQRQQDWHEQLTYWRRQLGGDLPTLQLPLDKPRTAQRSDRGAAIATVITPEILTSIAQLGREANVTLFMTLLSAFKLLLCCYTPQRDIPVGTDLANRNRQEVEAAIGFFINLLVLRTDLSGNPTFRELLQRIRTVTLDAYDRQDVPFAKLVDVLKPERQDGLMPLFQVLFVLQNAPLPALEVPGLTLVPAEPDYHAAKFDLALFVRETAAGLTVTWNYKTDVFETATVDQLAQQYLDLLQALIANPDTPIETMTDRFSPGAISPQPKRKRFQKVKPKAVRVSATEVVRFSQHPIGIGLYEPQVAAANLAAWATENRAALERQLQTSGALLFRGFDLPDARAFETVSGAICPELFGNYGDLPRTGVSGKVYGSTPYPEDRAILFHNESSHLQKWPMKIWFFCVQPSPVGGETPIVNCRQLYQTLRPETRDRFATKQLMYERNFVPGLDVDWRDFFKTDDRAEVERRCEAEGVEWTWLENGRLRTRQVRQAIARHPHTQDLVFFNQLQLHHFSYIDPNTQASIRSLLGEDCLPRQVYYGDGSEIEPEVLEEVDAAYQTCARQFTWQKGDLLMLDNMLMAHGRNPFQGPRKIVVALGEMIQRDRLSMIG
ncbi:non-ribosomal peptide synthetase module [Rubidibacter lacunae KORDI 51-2]|uniref:Non-ribosomal peptide synthetase module n=1 Tax=Rubidibacter lacunae KORDI 51-2 TaxID=582515 RepID=U5DK94_9CHRO|nr:condensation domain-containing protein [Rubidibacter lacunae]ERN42086.1 non-ribosomal peptide synthetase module [Rubidibacter lacunae KORDI 51-2]